MTRLRVLIGSLAALALSTGAYHVMLGALAERTQGAGLLAAGDLASALLAAALIVLRLSSLVLFPAAVLGAAMWFCAATSSALLQRVSRGSRWVSPTVSRGRR